MSYRLVSMTMSKMDEQMTAILKAVELYAEAGRKGIREIGEKAFTEKATMSWVEDCEQDLSCKIIL